MSQPRLQIHRIHEAAQVPVYKTPHAAGLDIAACPHDGTPVTIEPGDIQTIPCGFAMALTPGYEAQVRPRSGLASKFGITLPNAPGTIDADYRGEVRVPLINLGREPFTVEPGMRIAQMVIAPVAQAEVLTVDAAEQLGDTERGQGGFGSTGLG